MNFNPDWIVPPGATIQRLMQRRGVTFEDLSSYFDEIDEDLGELISGRRVIDDTTADALSQVLGSSKTFWLNRERTYRQGAHKLSLISTDTGLGLSEWASLFPISDMKKFGWIPANIQKSSVGRALLDFFGVQSLEEWRSHYRNITLSAAYRTSATFSANPASVAVWLRRAEMRAADMAVADWQPDLLVEILPELRQLTRRGAPERFVGDLTRICASVGIALVIEAAPKGCRASGATKFISPDKAMIVLSHRYKTDDHFWFTFFHELGHLVLHAKDMMFLEDNSDAFQDEEREANQFAADILISPSAREEMLEMKLTKNAVMRFAVRQGVSSGIVVGQLQHLGYLKPNQLQFLKRRYEWGVSA